jgi:hypothetical protein
MGLARQRTRHRRAGEHVRDHDPPENVGDGAGTFRGAVNFSYPMYMPKAFDVALDSGESGTATVEAEIEDAEAGKAIEDGVRTSAGESTVAVTVEGWSRPTAAPE